MPTDEAQVVRVKCPRLTCQHVLLVRSDARGKLVRCRGCGRLLLIPGGRVTSAAEPSRD